MASVADIFNPGSTAVKRTRVDSAVEGFSADSSKELPQRSKSFSVDIPPTEVLLTIKPSTGSSCVSLYPRTKSFSFKSAIDERSCLATSSAELWKITAEQPQSPETPLEESRFTFERLPPPEAAEDADDDEAARPIELWKGCRVTKLAAGDPAHPLPRRRVSVGNYSSGFSGQILPMSPTF